MGIWWIWKESRRFKIFQSVIQPQYLLIFWLCIKQYMCRLPICLAFIQGRHCHRYLRTASIPPAREPFQFDFPLWWLHPLCFWQLNAALYPLLIWNSTISIARVDHSPITGSPTIPGLRRTLLLHCWNPPYQHILHYVDKQNVLPAPLRHIDENGSFSVT